jgi:hypothetical protein
MDVLLITKPSKRRDQKNVDYKCQLKMKNKTKTEDGDRGRRERGERGKKKHILLQGSGKAKTSAYLVGGESASQREVGDDQRAVGEEWRAALRLNNVMR